MGIITCKPEREADLHTRRIDTEINIENQANRRKVKMLLLGISDSGKSTIVKQMRVNYMDGFNETEIVNAIFVVRSNIIEAFRCISNVILQSDIAVSETEEVLIRLFATDSNKIEMMQEMDELNVINTVRTYKCVEEYFDRFSFHPSVPENIHYFFPNLERIAMANYIPTTEDVIHMRQTTLGVHEISFNFLSHTIRLIDVGGQKTERRKWIHFFEGVTAVMFVCSLASYNQSSEEEPKSIVSICKQTVQQFYELTQEEFVRIIMTRIVWESSSNKVQNKVSVRSCGKAKVERPGLVNRLDESVGLFKSIHENGFLRMSNFMLFMNKKDIFEEKLKQTKFVDTFPGYRDWLTSDNTPASVAEYIEGMFREGLATDNCVYSHLTCATETANIDYTFSMSCEVICNKTIEETSLE